MPVLNDFGEEAYRRVVAQLDAFAAKLNIPKEIIRQYWSDTAHLPQSLAELKAWGLKPDREYGQIRYDQATGVWTPLGTGPTPGKTPEQRGGFPHFITNQVGDAQRFQQVDANGNIFTGSWDPEYNRAHFDAQGRPIAAALGTATTQGATVRSAQANPYPPGTPEHAAWEQGNPSGQPFDPNNPSPPGTSPPSTGAAPAAGTGTGGTGTPGGSGLGPLVDAAAYGNTQRLQAEIDDALRRYAIARTQEERNQAYLDLQRWKQELDKVQGQQKTVADMATAVLSAATTLGSRPSDYVKFNQATSGGRDILEQISGSGGPVAAYGGPTGVVQPGSVWDLLGRLGLQYPQTPATPAGVQPGAANPVNPDLPAVPVPGAGGTPAPGTAQAASLPATYEQALRELDQAAGGQWSGNRTDKNAVASAWWGANPSRRGTPTPAHAWG